MHTDAKIVCTGGTVCNLIVPPFEIRSTEFVGITHPGEYCAKWNEFLEALAGCRRTSSIRTYGEAGMIRTPFTLHIPDGESIFDFMLKRAQMPAALARRVIQDNSLDAGAMSCTLPPSPSAIVSLYRAWANGNRIVVFSSAGLDRSGMAELFGAVRNRLGEYGAVDLFSPATGQPVSEYDRVIHCSMPSTSTA